MGRLIDADALIDDCKKYLNTLNPDRDGKECSRIGWLIRCLNDAPTAEPEQRWIPCSEMLPELDEDGFSDKVLVCFTNYSGSEICEYRECDDCHGWYVGDSDDNPEDIGVHVLAWMPLPEPYRGEGEK